jgi:benzoylformate decarboxylase
MLGRDLVLEAFRQYGVEYLFGNPGTTELPLMDGLVNYPEIKYILGLHEDIAVGMAAGYAQATGKPGVVNLHVAPGLAHGLGNIYDAYRAGVPLVVTTGQHDIRLGVQEPALWGDLVALAKSCTKWSYQVHRAEELPIVLHRAFKEALTEPMGPVFLSFPVDVMWQDVPLSPLPLTRIDQRVSGSREASRQAVALLRAAERPVIVAGDRVGRTGAIPELIRLSELIGAPVYQEHQSAGLNFPYNHPHFAGRFLPNGPAIHEALKEADVVLFLGVISQAPLLYFDKPLVQPGTKVISVDLSPWEIGKNMPADVAILGHPREVLAAWVEMLQAELTPADEGRCQKRREQLQQQQREREEAKARELAAVQEQMPLSPAVVMAELNHYLTDDVFVVDESVTTGRYVHRYLELRRPGAFIGLKGGGLGYGMPAALGAQLGRPSERVVAIIGDGSSYYYIQSLWNAARYNLPVLYLIINNTSYMILKGGMLTLNGVSAKQGAFPGMDLDQPEIDLVSVARGFGVEAQRIETREELKKALQHAFSERKPYLLDVVVDRTVKPYLA